MLNIAMLSRWHVHADDYAREILENPELEIQAVWDENHQRGSAWAAELGVPFVADLDTVLSDPNINGVIVDTPTNMHTNVIRKAAQHKKHIFSEKVLGLSTTECDRIFEEVKAKNVHLMLSLPRLSDPPYLAAKRAIDNGWLGQLTLIRCRIAHSGALPFDGHPHGWLPDHFFDPLLCGGGALIDLGAHAIYLSNRFGGHAASVQARFSKLTGHAVDDNAVVLVEYESGALGVLEAGFVSEAGAFLLELHGTEGSIMVHDHQVKINAAKSGHDGWHEVSNLPAQERSAMQQWVDVILRGVEPDITWHDMWWLTRINELAAESDEKGIRINA